MLIYPPHVLAEMARICTAHGTLLIADEVMTGWGRTGTFLACEQAGIAPDILCMAKGLTGGAIPLAITLASSAIYDAHYAPDRAKTFYHSSSYTANPIACAAACANLEIWREEPVRERIADLCAAGGRRKDAGAGAGHRQCASVWTILALDYVVEGGLSSSLQPRLLAFFREAGVLIRLWGIPPI
jgi:adenosylmethionine-8-amino-7-oxononanoate aminotransferase